MGINGFIAVGIGAALGAWSRWLLGLALNASFSMFPLGTLAANLIGGYLIGIFIGITLTIGEVSPELRLFITTGFLGGLTTFSAFSGEAVSLLMRGEYGWGIGHILLHVVGTLLMTALGIITVNILR